MIKSIKATNFLSWENLEFNVEDGVTLIKGFNHDDNRSEGSGKSAVVNALSWGLYGKLPKDVKIDEVIRDGQKSCMVAIEIGYDFVVRTRHPNELFILKYDGSGHQKVMGKDARETQKLIEEFVGLSFDSFVQTIYFAQDYEKKFISATQEEKGKILSEIQELEIFEKARKEAHEMLKAEKSGLDKLKNDHEKLNTEYSHQDELIKQVDSRIQDRIRSAELEHSNIGKAIEQIDARCEERAKTVKETLGNIADQMTETHGDIEKLQNELDLLKDATNNVDVVELQNYIKSSNDVIAIQQQEQQKVMGQLGVFDEKAKMHESNKSNKEKVVSSIQFLVRRFEENINKKHELEAFIKDPTKQCPTCGTVLKNQDTTHTADELAKVITAIESNEADLTKLDIQIGEIEKEINDYVELDKSELEIKLDSLKDDISKLQEAIRKYQDQIKDFESNSDKQTSLASQIVRLETKVKKLATEYKEKGVIDLSDLLSEKELLSNKLIELQTTDVTAELKRDKEMLQNTKQELLNKGEQVMNLIEDKNTQIARLETLKSGFKEIKSYIFGSVLNELMTKANTYVQELFEVPVKVIFKNDDMKITTEVVLDGQSRSLGTLSGGQYRRTCLAVDLALSDIVTSRKNTKFNMRILDEYFKNLSETSMNKCLALLEKLNGATLMIEHNSIFNSIVDKTFDVELRNKVSREVK